MERLALECAHGDAIGFEMSAELEHFRRLLGHLSGDEQQEWDKGYEQAVREVMRIFASTTSTCTRNCVLASPAGVRRPNDYRDEGDHVTLSLLAVIGVAKQLAENSHFCARRERRRAWQQPT